MTPGLGVLFVKRDANEPARMLYVGMTRTMNELVMTAHWDSEFAVMIGTDFRDLAA